MKNSLKLLWVIYECPSDHTVPVECYSSLIHSKALWRNSDITDSGFGHWTSDPSSSLWGTAL